MRKKSLAGNGDKEDDLGDVIDSLVVSMTEMMMLMIMMTVMYC